jgi:hypothetical protein
MRKNSPQSRRLHSLLRTQEQKKTLDVYPEILVSCRQLHSEGSPILYSNNVSVVFSNMPGGIFLRSLVIGHIDIMPQPGEYIDIPHGPTPVSRSKMYVTLKIEGDNEVLDVVFARAVGIILSRSLVGLRELTIDIAINPHLLTAFTNPHLADLSEPWIHILQGLLVLRGIPSVKFTGTIPETEGAKLAAMITRRPPDLPFIPMKRAIVLRELRSRFEVQERDGRPIL